MKKRNWISAIITMILAGSLCVAMPQTVAEVVPNHSSPYSISEDESLSKAERYFGWTDPNRRLKVEDLTYFKIILDGKEMRFIGYSRAGRDWAELYDVSSGEPIVKININSRNNVIQLYDYFEKDTLIERDAEISVLDISSFPKDKRKLAQQSIEQEDISLEEIVELMLLIDSDITSWYSNTRLPSLDNFNYTNKVPSINDDKLIEIKKFNMLYQFNENSNRTKEIDGLIVFLERNEEGNQNVFYDLFSNQKICSAENNRVLDFYPNIFEIKEKKFNNVFVENIGPVFYDYVRPLRQCIEVKDGVEYYNVGKLRKLYENLPQDKTVDYSMFLSQKPGNEEFEIDRQNDLPGDEAESGSNGPYAELTIGSSGQDVLAMKQRFFELGYFRTTSFNDRFTDSTADTVRLFEKNNGLPVDGEADAVMLGVLFSDKALGK